MANGAIDRKQTVTRRRLHAVENELPLVGHIKTVFTRDVPGDEQVGVHFFQKLLYRGRTGIASPNQRMDASARPKILLLVRLTLQNGRVEIREARALGRL